MKKIGNQIPIRHSAVEKAAKQASAVSLILPDGTTASTTIGKDIPFQEGMDKASWFGDVKGAAPTLAATLRDKIIGRDSPEQLTLCNHMGYIAAFWGNFNNFWSICLV